MRVLVADVELEPLVVAEERGYVTRVRQDMAETRQPSLAGTSETRYVASGKSALASFGVAQLSAAFCFEYSPRDRSPRGCSGTA